MQVAKQYDQFAQTYATIISNENRLSNDAFYRHMDFMIKGKHLLDVGCGEGSDLLQLSQEGAITYGVDASNEMVKIASVKNPQATICQGLLEEIPFPAKSFDIVVSKWAIQTAIDIDPIYKEVARVLKPNGMMLFLIGHPLRQFLEKKKYPKDYFEKEVVSSVLFGGHIEVKEPTHTFNEFLSPYFFSLFNLLAFEEGFDASGEQIAGDIYPMFFILKAKKH